MLNYLTNNPIFLLIGLGVAGFFFLDWISGLRNVRLKKFGILTISIAMIAVLDHWSLLLLIGFATCVFFLVKLQVDLKKHLYLIVIGLILLLILIKDYGVFLDIERPYIPLGVSYYFFRLISIIIDYSNNPKRFEDIDALHYYTYVFFFPIFLAGPIQRFKDFFELDREYVEENKLRYYTLFIAALAGKFVLVDAVLYNFSYVYLFQSLSAVADTGAEGYPFFWALSAFGFLTFLHAYLDLMLYTEMSKALSRILGFSIQENFDRPLLASNISNFWQRWHLSLSNWTRDYVFFPALIRTRKTWLSTYLSMLTIGVWHSASLNWITWALSHGTAINLYGEMKKLKLYKKVIANRAGHFFMRVTGNIVTIYFVSIVFLFVAIHDFSLVLRFLGIAFGEIF